MSELQVVKSEKLESRDSLSEDLPRQAYLENLNPAQYEAVVYGDGPLLVFAGAGSGKTRVLTRRIAHLIHGRGVYPENILAVTFTNKAASEMKQRVNAMLSGQQRGSSYVPSWVSTFHSIGARILRAHAEALNFTSQFAIYDTDESMSVLKRAYKKHNIDPKLIDPRTVRSYIDRAKNEYQGPDYLRNSCWLAEQWAHTVADLYESYQAELLKSNAMDFGDLLCNTVSLFKLEPQILKKYQDQFEHVLIDEYQDTNKVQYILIKMLTETRKNICVVGDDDQSIYGFRGANVENILNFKKDFPDAKTVILDINYRSTKTILSAANAVIAQNKQRQQKKMRTDNPTGPKIICYRAYDEKDEGRFVAREISALHRLGVLRKNIAVFYRTNAQSRSVEEAFCETGIPYQIFGGHKFYDRKEIRDVLAYLRLVINERDNEAFLRIINTPTRGLGATSVGALIAYAQKERMPLLPALEKVVSEKGENVSFLSGSVKSKFLEFLSLIKALRHDALTAEQVMSAAEGNITTADAVQALPQFLEAIAKKTQYLSRLKALDTLEAESRIENIYELFSVAMEFSQTAIEEGRVLSIHDFLVRTSLSSDLDGENTKTDDSKKAMDDSVSMMTLHLAKGLEFDFVFLVGFEEGILPHVRAIYNGDELEEERRLCYVGFTRARRQLHISYALERHTYQKNNWNSGVASRFFDDLPDELIDFRRPSNREQEKQTGESLIIRRRKQ